MSSKQKQCEKIQQQFEDERINREIIKSLKLNSPALEEEPLVKQFLIIGSDAAEQPNYQSSGYKKKIGVVKPKILFQFPSISLDGFSYNLLEQFCFPDVTYRKKRTRQKEKDLITAQQKIYCDHLHYHKVFSFVFPGKRNELFAIGLRKKRFISRDPKEYETENICYILLTSVPFFEIHYHLLENILMDSGLNDFISSSIDSTQTNNSGLVLNSIQNLISVFTDYQKITVTPSTQTISFKFPNETNEFFYDCCCDMPLTYHYSELYLLTLFEEYNILDLLKMVTAFMLEHKILLVSKNLLLISAAIHFLLSSITPFKFESSIISVLCPELYTVLEAPTPLLVGMTHLPTNIPITKEYTFIADLDNKKFITPITFLLPNANGWVAEEINRTLNESPKRNTKIQLPQTQLIENEIGTTRHIMDVFKKAMEIIIEPFPCCCIKSVYEEHGKEDISCFMPEVFFAWWEEKDLLFIKQFVKTQMFENFKMRKLLEIDSKKKKEKTKQSE
ncbi:hypothetical protein ENUP19_0018G0067 [Entamoeba nuttalli]|uniref:UDENN domain-containing protein n=2 Tax=Entamoeba nuttalli TaxID=412467 RepID=K2H4G3_ENTNP|nr:hypothetical protein ENU1_200030 [Entamoeba nuttalli P19]EKE37374.1 hypothetical protein ENU1_200030 [Entamoeba nuttalli P19]|eukprot:XP_008860304.1 hypothetical protein ENU1_200030 [Entamoeba nuttalli P19]